MTTTISCIIPVHNGARHVGEAIESVLRQSLRPRELIVVDDGSVDDTPRVVRSFGDRVRYERQTHRGVSAARNRGIRLSVGELVAFLDADDLFVPRKLEFQARQFERNPWLEMSAGYVENFVDGELDDEQGHEFRRRVPWPRGLQTWVVRRSVFDRVGVFDEAMPLSQDVDWHLRAKVAGIVIETLPLILVRRRIHAGNNTRFANERCRAAVLESLRKTILSPRRTRAGGLP